MGWPTDSDGTFRIPLWVKFALHFVPSPLGPIIKLVIDIIDRLPAPKQAAVVDAYGQAKIKGNDSLLTEALHMSVLEAQRQEHEAGDRIR